jgi:hypothetical protein
MNPGPGMHAAAADPAFISVEADARIENLAADSRSRFQVCYAAFQIVSIVIRRSSASISRVEASQVTEFNA